MTDRPEWLQGLWVNVYSGTWVKTGWGTEPRPVADCDQAAGRDRVGRVHLWDGQFVPCNGAQIITPPKPTPGPCTSCGTSDEECNGLVHRKGKACCNRCAYTDTHPPQGE